MNCCICKNDIQVYTGFVKDDGNLFHEVCFRNSRKTFQAKSEVDKEEEKIKIENAMKFLKNSYYCSNKSCGKLIDYHRRDNPFSDTMFCNKTCKIRFLYQGDLLTIIDVEKRTYDYALNYINEYFRVEGNIVYCKEENVKPQRGYIIDRIKRDY